MSDEVVATTEKVFYKYRKLSIVNDFIQQYICKTRDSKECLDMIMSAFEIDSIFLYDMYDDRFINNGSRYNVIINQHICI